MVVPHVDRLQLWVLRLVGAQQRWESTTYGRIHLLDIPGKVAGPTLVILHGLGDAGVHFWSTVLRLRRHFGRILVPDLLGHGWSDDHAELSAELIFAALLEVLDRALAAKPAVVFGNSLGGALALATAQMRPDLVSRLILVSPAGAPWSDDEYEGVLNLFRMEVGPRAVEFVHRLHARPIWYARFIAADVARNLARPAMRHLVESLRRSPAQTPEMMALIQAPALLLWGRADAILPQSSVSFFREHLRGAIEEPDDWGHCPQLDRPWSLAERVRRWALDEA